MTPDLQKIPQELKDRPQWVVWREEAVDGKKTKIPYQARNPKQKASSTNSETWGTLEQSLSALKTNGIAGIGYVFSPQDDFSGVDLDHCRDPETGQLKYCAQALIDYLQSYTEISPSETGLHFIIRGKVPIGGNTKGLPCGGKVEMYSEGRYFTVTGLTLEGTPTTIEDRQAELTALHREIFGKPQALPRDPGPSPTLDLSDQELIDQAHRAANGEKFSKLWLGDIAGYDSPSEATAALLSHLVFRCGPDPARVDRLFRQSGLMRDKWDRPQSGSTWGNLEIHKAIARATEFYTPSHRPQAPDPSPKTAAQEDPRITPAPSPGPQRSAAPAIRFVTGPELQATEFKDPEWIIQGILPEGLCLLTARPKKGKTRLATNISVAKSSGGFALGKSDLRITQGKVLYLCLEDKLRRIKKLLEVILGDAPFPEDLILAESWPRLDKGGLEALREFLKEHNDCKLVVVDSYSKIKPARPKNADPYDFEMAVGGALQTLAQEHQICLLIIYHNRKAEAEDPLDDVIGSTGLTGAVDAVLILKRGRGQADGTLFISGRDVAEQELALKFHPREGLWELLGTAAEYARSRQRQEIIEVIEQSGPQTPKEVAKFMEKPYETIKKTMQRMAWDGELRSKEGKYYIERE